MRSLLERAVKPSGLWARGECACDQPVAKPAVLLAAANRVRRVPMTLARRAPSKPLRPSLPADHASAQSTISDAVSRSCVTLSAISIFLDGAEESRTDRMLAHRRRAPAAAHEEADTAWRSV